MESSKNFDLPPVLKPEFERRLVRVFAFLRQHERKARLAKKTAELNALKDTAKRIVSLLEPPVKNASAADLLNQELFGNQPKVTAAAVKEEDTAGEATRETVVKILESEIEELQRTINFKDFDTTGTISAGDLSSALRALNRPTSKAEVQWIIWEVDDDLDGCVDWDEFRGAYARCIVDRQGTEPNQLFHLTHFLLSDPDGGSSASVADLKAEFERLRGTDHLTNRIKTALGATTEQQEQQRHPLGPYMEAVLIHLPTGFVQGSHFPPKQ